ncbi:MAG: 2-methylisocitrate lyase [Ponticaulis sp.]|nr:2-methylisocitrate lyase [Ponticaulis sp.]|tara:strand:+ start:44121 stop:44945 length:825 start_codon:yes stop_codon:yes gene_type:complete
MKTQSEKAAEFQALHESGCFVFPNPWDVGSARMLAGLGFPALATTSQGFANAIGVLDYQITREMKMEHCRQLCASVNLPMAADLENGYGHPPEDCAETIRLAAEAGLVGGSIEDYDPENDVIYAPDAATERVRAAVEVANALPFPFLVTGRAENYLHNQPDLADTIKRLQAYQEAGAHVLYAPFLPDLDAVKSVLAEIDHPLNVLGPSLAKHTIEELADIGVRRISLGSSLHTTILGTLVSAAEELQGPGSYGFLKGMLSGARRDELLAKGTPD